jgi:hypothetical protein
VFHLPKMLHYLFFSPKVVKISCWMNCFFPPEIVEVPLATMFLKSKKKILRLTPQKKVLRTAPAEGFRSWSHHDLRDQIMIWSWSGSPNTPEKRTSRDQHGDLVIQIMIWSWSGSRRQVFVTSERWKNLVSVCFFARLNLKWNQNSDDEVTAFCFFATIESEIKILKVQAVAWNVSPEEFSTFDLFPDFREWDSQLTTENYLYASQSCAFRLQLFTSW